jgi:hypothetical protein
VVIKPSEVSPSCSAVIAELVPQYFDNECVKVVEGAVPETTALLKERLVVSGIGIGIGCWYWYWFSVLVVGNCRLWVTLGSQVNAVFSCLSLSRSTKLTHSQTHMHTHIHIHLYMQKKQQQTQTKKKPILHKHQHAHMQLGLHLLHWKWIRWQDCDACCSRAPHSCYPGTGYVRLSPFNVCMCVCACV